MIKDMNLETVMLDQLRVGEHFMFTTASADIATICEVRSLRQTTWDAAAMWIGFAHRDLEGNLRSFGQEMPRGKMVVRVTPAAVAS